MTSAMRTMPSESASGRSPLLVSNAIAVVINARQRPHSGMYRLPSVKEALGVDLRDLVGSEQHGRVLLTAEHVPDRSRDRRCSQAGRRDLVEQRLEDMVVRPVDNGDAHRSAPQRLRRPQPAEPCTEDDYVRVCAHPA